MCDLDLDKIGKRFWAFVYLPQCEHCQLRLITQSPTVDGTGQQAPPVLLWILAPHSGPSSQLVFDANDGNAQLLPTIEIGVNVSPYGCGFWIPLSLAAWLTIHPKRDLWMAAFSHQIAKQKFALPF